MGLKKISLFPGQACVTCFVEVSLQVILHCFSEVCWEVLCKFLIFWILVQHVVVLVASPTLCDPMFYPWNSVGKNTGVGCHSLHQRIFLTQGLNQGLLHCRQILYHLSHQGSNMSGINSHWVPCFHQIEYIVSDQCVSSHGTAFFCNHN